MNKYFLPAIKIGLGFALIPPIVYSFAGSSWAIYSGVVILVILLIAMTIALMESD